VNNKIECVVIPIKKIIVVIRRRRGELRGFLDQSG
jgi:hypothetical protein